MRIVRDAEGDIWEETAPDYFKCRSVEDVTPRSLDYIEAKYGPVEVFGSKASVDTSVYRVTHSSGAVKFRLRDFEPGELIAREPGLLVFEVIRDDTTYVFPVHPEDVAALSALTVQYNAHCGLPVTVGEGLIISA